jgi:hypothetical protein
LGHCEMAAAAWVRQHLMNQLWLGFGLSFQADPPCLHELQSPGLAGR